MKTVIEEKQVNDNKNLIASLEEQAEAVKVEAKSIRDQIVSLLPVASEEQFAAILKAVRNEQPAPKGMIPGKDVKLLEKQKELIKDARDERKKELKSKRAKNRILEDLSNEDEVITSHKVQELKSGGFRRSLVSEVDSASVIARLRKENIELRKLAEKAD